MPSRKIEDLVPEMAALVPAFLAEAVLAVKNAVIITCTARYDTEQAVLYAQGREPIEDVNRKRKNIGWPPISEQDNKKVTWTLDSKHIVHLPSDKARAFDFAIVVDGKALWNAKVCLNDDDIPAYEKIGLIAEKYGWKWGGRWKTPDFPHIEMKDV